MNSIYLEYGNKKITLTHEAQYTIGRPGEGTTIEIDDQSVSRKHALISLQNEKLSIQDFGSSNGTFVNGKRITVRTPIPIIDGDKVMVGATTLHFSWKQMEKKGDNIPKKEQNQEPLATFKQEIQKKGNITIGRAPDNSIVLDDPTVSRKHARISFDKGMFWVEDLGSVNKTYLNGQPLSTKKRLQDDDLVVIAFYSISLLKGLVNLKEHNSAIKAVNVQKKYPNNKIGLQAASLEIPHRNIAALMGPSGCGKSTLLKCLNGDNPATSGEVLIHGLSLEQNFKLIKKKIGYVPQDDIIHKELTVYKTLFYASKLRLPDDTSQEEIDHRINKVIASLKLDQDKEKDIRGIKVGDLSGGQRKRISIAVELLTEPTILFLDEPTSPLDPETIESFLKSLRELAKEGTTIIMVTHKPEDLNYVDQVIFLGVQGHLTYKGPASQLTGHFKVDNIVEVYTKMSDLELVRRYYQKPKIIESGYVSNAGINREKPDSLPLQLYWLTLRYLKIKLNDKRNLLLLVLQPLIIGGLVSLVFKEFRIGVLFLTTISAIWFGVSNAAKEIVGELSVYRRERMFNLNINTYILSKCVVLSIIAFLQILLFISIVYVNFKLGAADEFPGTYLRPFWESVAFMFYVSFSATLIGLLLSAYFSTTEKVMTVVPITLMPQILLAGIMTKIETLPVELLSFFTLGRWGTEGFSRIVDGFFEGKGLPRESVLVTDFVPDPSKLTNCNCKAVAAIDQLQLYDQDLIDNGRLIGSIFDSLDANLMVITLMNIGIYLLIYFSLKSKDSI